MPDLQIQVFPVIDSIEWLGTSPLKACKVYTASWNDLDETLEVQRRTKPDK